MLFAEYYLFCFNQIKVNNGYNEEMPEEMKIQTTEKNLKVMDVRAI